MSGIPDRRRHLRQRVRSLTYIDLGQNNGGIILNISEGGLALQAAALLTSTLFPSMRIKLPGCSDWLEASGELTWTSDSGKEAGVRFVNISDDARFQIRQWVSVGGNEPREGRTGRTETGREVLAGPMSDVAKRTAVQSLAPELVARQQMQNVGGRSAEQREDARAPKPLWPKVVKPESHTPELVQRQQGWGSLSTGIERGRDVSQTGYPSGPKRMTPEPAVGEGVITERAPNPSEHLINSVRVARMLGGERDYGSFDSLMEKPDSQGWMLAVVFTVLAVIALAAGIAVGRGDLSGMLDRLSLQRNSPAARNPGTPEDAASPTPAAEADVTPPSDSSNADVSQIEVLDANNRRWLVPLQGAAGGEAASGKAPNASGANPGESSAAAESTPTENVPTEKVKKAPEATTEDATRVRREVPKETPAGIRIEVRTWILAPAVPIEKVGQPIYRVDPVYPPEAIQQHVEGAVKLRAIIGRDGTIQSLGLIDGPPLLVPAAMDAVRSWRNRPTMVNGRAVEVDEQIQVEFRLPG